MVGIPFTIIDSQVERVKFPLQRSFSFLKRVHLFHYGICNHLEILIVSIDAAKFRSTPQCILGQFIRVYSAYSLAYFQLSNIASPEEIVHFVIIFDS